MRVLSFINPVQFGGGERLTLDLGRFFAVKKIAFTVANLNQSTEFENALHDKNISFQNLSNIRLKQTPHKSDYIALLIRLSSIIPKIRRTIITQRPDCVLVNGFPAVFLVAGATAFLSKRPRMIYVHHSLKTKENFLTGLVHKTVLGKYDRIIAVSSRTRDSLIAQFPRLASRIVVIPNGIDIERFYTNEDKQLLRKKLGLPQGVLAINVGRMSPSKNQIFLVSLAKEIRRDDFHILIVGDGDERERLARIIAAEKLNDCVILLGSVDSRKLPDYLAAADMFLFPSIREGFGIAVAEAMAAGLPAVIFRDIYIEEFGSDILVAKDTNEFRAMTTRLIETPEMRQSLGKRAAQYAAVHLGITTTGEKTLEAITE